MPAFSRSLLRYPFPDILHPQVDELEAFATQVVDACNIVASLRNTIKAAAPGSLIAGFFPLAPTACLFTVVRYLVFAFIVEETYTRLPYTELESRCKRIQDFLKDGRVLPGDGEDIRQLKLCMDEAIALSATPQWLQRFGTDTDAFCQSLLTETTFYENSRPVRYPDMEQCIRYREDQTAVYPFIDYAELVLNTYMPDHIYNHPFIQQLRTLTARFIVYVNDLYSVEKDIFHEEMMNVCLIIQHETGCSLMEAQERTWELNNQELAVFMSLCTSPPDLGAYNKAIGRYIRYLQQFIQGNLSWHRYSSRYII